ncbi:hypothetical protein GIB67_042805 [Kingdonia uniflora]|uniref:DYW domain-containing protein n=1 Tax=Kingdonia uniflora TaxID=39325 RepID=A0A7J7L108_9MAGN|nr:hypothetical protein GIB67_042805 [Kingdonia uniflora]
MRAKSSNLKTLLKPIFKISNSSLPTAQTSQKKSLSYSPHPTIQPQFCKHPFPKSEVIENKLCIEKKLRDAVTILCQQNRLKKAIQILDLLDEATTHPSPAIYFALFQLCFQLRALEDGKRVYSHTKKTGFKLGLLISNRLINLYSKLDSLEDARTLFDEMSQRDSCSWNTIIGGYTKGGNLEEGLKLFNEMPEKDSFSWNTMISGYVRNDRPGEALELLRRMQKENFRCNGFTVSSALSASSALQCLRLGMEIHGHIMRTGLDSDTVVWSALSDMYAKCKSIEQARYIFDRTLDQDIVSWTTMIMRYFEGGRRKEGFELFSELLRSGMRPNDFTFSAVLNACSAQIVEYLGKQVHGYVTVVGFNSFSFVAGALIHMYSKCGNVASAEGIFKGITQPDLITWTAIISGYAQNGEAEKALKYFELLLKSGTKPDHVTFVAVLSACTHAGLVDKGLEYFESITTVHGLSYIVDHYSCVIDLLSRSARFQEAEKIIDSMPMKPNKYVWASLLGGCRVHGNLELAKRAAEALFEIEPDNAATYVTLANIYASAGMWGEEERVRKAMDERWVVKKPGSSWIGVKRQVHVFFVGDKSHPRVKEIYDYLDKLSIKMKEEGYIPKTNYVLHDVEEEQKEHNLSYHSEKLAISFGIVATPPGTLIKVFKNLRTCGDCHNAIKFISKIARREIIVRDSIRFHRFKDGSCSCGDFW